MKADGEAAILATGYRCWHFKLAIARYSELTLSCVPSHQPSVTKVDGEPDSSKVVKGLHMTPQETLLFLRGEHHGKGPP
jgi:hypothetical protein